MNPLLVRLSGVSAAIVAAFVIASCALDSADSPRNSMAANTKPDPQIGCQIHGVNGQNKPNVVCSRQASTN